MKNPCRKCAAKANLRPFFNLVNNPNQYVLVCHPYVTRMYSYVIRMSLVCGFTMNLKNQWKTYEWVVTSVYISMKLSFYIP